MIPGKILTLIIAAAWLGKALYDAVIMHDIKAVTDDFAAFVSTVAVQSLIHPTARLISPSPVPPTIIVVPPPEAPPVAPAAAPMGSFIPSPQRTNAGDTSSHINT